MNDRAKLIRVDAKIDPPAGVVRLKVQDGDLALPKEVAVPFPTWYGITAALLQLAAAGGGAIQALPGGAPPIIPAKGGPS